jgi:hypothetical protein
MNKLFVVIILVFFSFEGYSQNEKVLDSLPEGFKSAEDSLLIRKKRERVVFVNNCLDSINSDFLKDKYPLFLENPNLDYDLIYLSNSWTFAISMRYLIVSAINDSEIIEHLLKKKIKNLSVKPKKSKNIYFPFQNMSWKELLLFRLEEIENKDRCDK